MQVFTGAVLGPTLTYQMGGRMRGLFSAASIGVFLLVLPGNAFADSWRLQVESQYCWWQPAGMPSGNVRSYQCGSNMLVINLSTSEVHRCQGNGRDGAIENVSNKIMSDLKVSIRCLSVDRIFPGKGDYDVSVLRTEPFAIPTPIVSPPPKWNPSLGSYALWAVDKGNGALRVCFKWDNYAPITCADFKL